MPEFSYWTRLKKGFSDEDIRCIGNSLGTLREDFLGAIYPTLSLEMHHYQTALRLDHNARFYYLRRILPEDNKNSIDA